MRTIYESTPLTLKFDLVLLYCFY